MIPDAILTLLDVLGWLFTGIVWACLAVLVYELLRWAGLPVARKLAQAMGGALTYSRESGLTTFELKLDLPPAASALSDVASDVDRVEHADAVDIRRIPA